MLVPIALAATQASGELIQFENADFSGVSTIFGPGAPIVTTSSRNVGAAQGEFVYSVTGLTLDADGTANDSLDVTVQFVAGAGGDPSVFTSTSGSVPWGVKTQSDSSESLATGEGVTFSISSIEANLSGGGSSTASYDFTSFDPSGWNGPNRKFQWAINGGSEGPAVSGSTSSFQINLAGSEDTSFSVRSSANSGYVRAISFDVTFTLLAEPGTLPSGGGGGWIGSLQIPGSGTKSAVDSVVNAALVPGTEQLSLHSLVGLGQEEVGDVSFQMRVGFDNGTFAQGVQFSLDETADDVFTSFESRVNVPEGAQRLTSVELVFRQAVAASAQTAYIDNVSVDFASGYGGWKTIYGYDPAESDANDDDGDAVALLVEYGLDLDPNAPSSIDEALAFSLADEVSGRSLQLAYLPVRSDLNYVVKSSTNLSDWGQADVDQGEPGLDGVVRASTTTTGELKFLRLELTPKNP